jgi:hypothetical protein
VPDSYKYDFVFLPRARRDYERLDPLDQAEIDRLVELLCEDPAVDNVRKFDFPMPPAILRLFDNERWAIFYSVIDPSVVQLWAIAPSTPGEPPRLRQ